MGRLSVANLEDLKRRILRVIAHCNKPKVRGAREGAAGARPPQEEGCS